MKILCIADIHGNAKKAFEIKESIDLILVAGDITNFGGRKKAEEVIETLKRISSNIFAVPGNCDYKEVLDFLEESKISLHGKGVKINEIGIFGVGGSNKTPFATPFELSENEIAKLLESGYGSIKECKIKILLSHAPAFGILDKTSSGVHAGSKAVKRFLDKNKVDYVVCGHIHEAAGIAKVKETIFINPGKFSHGYVILHPETGKIEKFS